jgi:hypothetical protein
MIDNIDMNQIATVLSQLVHNYNQLATNWRKIFFDGTPTDIVLTWFDEDGNLINTDPLPNLAKCMNYFYHGEGDPEGVVDAPTGSLYQDTQNGLLYLKRTTEGTAGHSINGWRPFTALNECYSRGQGVPKTTEGYNIGDLYSDEDSGTLYTLTEAGWEAVGSSGFAPISWCEAEFAKLRNEIGSGVVHRTGDEEVRGSKTFVDKNIFEDITTFKKVIMGTAYRALSADIAEYYEADENLKPGTLIQFGGEKEITKAESMVNGIVSTEPAYILNTNQKMQHPTLIALSGRIPVRVKGPVHKFDLITLSTEKGLAKVDNSCYNPIGRALEENLSEEEKLVECVVKLNL